MRSTIKTDLDPHTVKSDLPERDDVTSDHSSLFSQSGEAFSVDSLIASPLQLGELSLRCVAEGDLISYELSRALSRGERERIALEGEDAGDEELRLAQGLFPTRLSHIQVKATLLDRPLVLSLERPLHLEPGGMFSVHLSRPLALELVACDLHGSSLKLCAAPLKALRLTSYGLVSQPMLCYHWVTQISPESIGRDEARVPLIINNQTKHPVELRKVILYKGYLKLYRSAEGFETNLVTVQITSKSEAQIEYDDDSLGTRGPLELIYESPSAAHPKLLKLLRLVSRRSAGIEYGF